MLAASNTLDEILRGTKGKKKRKPLKAYYYDVEGEIKYILYKEDNETYYDTLRDPQGCLHKQEKHKSWEPSYLQRNGGTDIHMYSSRAPKNTHLGI
jgi:hypothetical protein